MAIPLTLLPGPLPMQIALRVLTLLLGRLTLGTLTLGALTLGSGRATLMQGAVPLVLFTACLFLTVVA